MMNGFQSTFCSRDHVKIVTAGLVVALVALYLLRKLVEEIAKWRAWSRLPAPQDKAHPLLGNFKEWSKPGKRKQACAALKASKGSGT